ncbi:tetratricopeptide repeat protein, partial [Candidatus Pacearchaeota archaeon]|nr:tetratricopeptide repeat protein [Candidatus Pacearchaeota archaeon]
YFELAEALRNSNKPKSDVIAAYKRWSSKKQHLMNLAGDSYSSRPFLIKPRAFASAMRWLYRNLPKNECEAIVRKSIHGVNLSEHQVSDITKGFKKLEDWNAYQLFLDVLFSEIGDVVTCAIAIEKSLKNHYWSEKILKYAEGNPVMAEYAVKRSTNVDRNQKTVKAYHSYLKQKNSKEESSSYEYEVVKTYFDSGQHEKGMVALDEYIDNNIESHKTEAMKGLMLKGRVLTQIDKIDKALKVYNKVVTAFEKEGLYNWEAKFQMGYCYMLQGNEEEARRILEQVVESCSDLPIGNKASLCLMNLK